MSIDDLDETFARDLEKIGKNVPSELALNAAKVKAVQDPKKPGAEKPDLGAPGLKKKAEIGKETVKEIGRMAASGAKKAALPVATVAAAYFGAKKGSEKKASIDEDLEKDAFSVTREGHKFDAERAKDRKEYLLRRSVALQKKDALGHSGKDGKNPAKLTSAMRFNNEGHTTAGARHQAYIEKKHREGKNAYNPFGGSMTKVKEEKGSTPGLLGTFGKVVKKASIDEDLEKDAFSVTREGHKFDAERAKDRKEYLLRRSVALQKKDALGHSGKDGKNPAKLTSAMRFNNEGHTTAGARHQAYIEKKHREGKNAYNPFGGSMTKVKEEKGSTPGLLGTFGKVVKKASIDEEFDSDLRQIVGADSAESVPDFERPCVKVAGQTTDLIDDAYVSWMREQADEDLVKAASSMDLARSVSYPTTKNIADAIDKGKRGAALKGALGATAVLGTAALAHKLVKGRTKTAGVIENPENKDLLARIRAKAGGSVDI